MEYNVRDINCLISFYFVYPNFLLLFTVLTNNIQLQKMLIKF